MRHRIYTVFGFLVVLILLPALLAVSSLYLIRVSAELQLLEISQITTNVLSDTVKPMVLKRDVKALHQVISKNIHSQGLTLIRVLAGDRIIAEQGDPDALKEPFLVGAHSEGVFAFVTVNVVSDITDGGEVVGRLETSSIVVPILDILFSPENRKLFIFIIGQALIIFVSIVFSTVYVLKQREKTERSHVKTEVSLRLMNEVLEQQVQERTRSLAMANSDLQHQAMHDSLTGLPNRRLLIDRLRQSLHAAKRENKNISLILLDLNRFKEINDSFGHHVGDGVLQEMASRLDATLRKSDTVSRLGGDEFALLLPSSADEKTAVHVARKVLSALQPTVNIGGRVYDVSASLGIVIFPQHGEDADVLLQRADIAMYAAKREKVGYVVYHPDLDRLSVERSALGHDLRQAIKNNEFLLYYQPKLDLRTNRVDCVEALIRWQHPTRGLIPPNDFIPLAEEIGFIDSLTWWVIESALTQIRHWDADGINLSISVNISAINLRDPVFSTKVIQLLGSIGVDPARLEFEITESTLINDPLRVSAVIRELSDKGVCFSIDDFGTGYSSLVYLRQLPLTTIKIDKSFVMGMRHDHDDATIVGSLIGLGRNLGMKVVAEGVENEEVANQLKSLGCDVAQGYWLSRPVPADALAKWLQNPTRKPTASAVGVSKTAYVRKTF